MSDSFEKADKKEHSVETQWHYPKMISHGYTAITKVQTGFIRTYLYRDESGHEVKCHTGYNADRWESKENQGYWNTLEIYLEQRANK